MISEVQYSTDANFGSSVGGTFDYDKPALNAIYNTIDSFNFLSHVKNRKKGVVFNKMQGRKEPEPDDITKRINMLRMLLMKS